MNITIPYFEISLKRWCNGMTQLNSQMESKAFWLKCWRSGATGDAVDVWRFSLEDPRTGKRVGFASLETLLIYVKSILSTDIGEEGDTDK